VSVADQAVCGSILNIIRLPLMPQSTSSFFDHEINSGKFGIQFDIWFRSSKSCALPICSVGNRAVKLSIFICMPIYNFMVLGVGRKYACEEEKKDHCPYSLPQLVIGLLGPHSVSNYSRGFSDLGRGDCRRETFRRFHPDRSHTTHRPSIGVVCFPPLPT
jgi:hypothetical protein